MHKIKTRFCLADLLVCLLVILSSAIPFIVRAASADRPGDTAIVSADGKETSYRLDEDREITLVSNGTEMTIVIEGGKIYVSESGCPDRVCVNTGKIDRPGQTIVCVPAKVMVTIPGGGDEDWIAY